MRSAVSNTLLIAKREYLERIRTKAFIVATILIPLLLGGLGFGSGYLAQRTKSSAHIAIVSSDQVFAADLKRELEQGKDSHMRVDVEPADAGTLTRLNAAIKNSRRLAGYLEVLPLVAAGGASWLSLHFAVGVGHRHQLDAKGGNKSGADA